MVGNRTVTTRVTTAGVLALTATAAWAGIVEPRETVVIDAADFSLAEGPVLAKSVLPFSIQYGGAATGSFVDFSGAVEGTLTSLVVRDESRGTLSFYYDVDLAGDGDVDASDASILTTGDFSGFVTDVDGALDFESVLLGSRTQDGGVRLASDDSGLGGPPRLLVRTDATHFAATGTARFFAGDELAVRTPDGLEIEFASGTAVIGGTFEPSERAEPNPIPLPPAVWAGILGLAGAGLASVGRSRG